jgi:hypothetical protein
MPIIAGLLALLLCAANAVVLEALAAPLALRTGANAWVILAAVASIAVGAPVVAAAHIAKRAHSRGLQPHALTILVASLLACNGVSLGLVALLSSRPLMVIVAEHGTWLPARLLPTQKFPPVESPPPIVQQTAGATEPAGKRAMPPAPDEPQPAAAELAWRGDRGLPALVEALDHGRGLEGSEVRSGAARAIAKMGPAGAPASSALRRLLLHDEVLQVQIDAAHALAATLGKGAVSMFREKGKQYYDGKGKSPSEVAVIRAVNKALMAMGESPCDVHRSGR